MTTFTAGLFGASVVVPGGAVMVENTYKGDGSTTLAAGDLVRINTSGQIVLAQQAIAAAGDIHGMVVGSDYASTAATTSQFVTILKFDADTELEIQLYAAAGTDAQPQDVTVGVGYRLKRNSAGIWSVDVANADGSAIVKAIPNESKWFDPDYDKDKDFGIVRVGFTKATLDGYAV